MNRWTHRLGSLALLLASCLVALLLLEVVLRLFLPGENIRTTATLGIFAPDPELGWVLKPDLRRDRRWAGRVIRIRTDADGHRIPDAGQSNAGPKQLVFAGDSYVFGHEVEAEETFAHLVGQAAGKRSVNLGVGGYRLDQECLALRRFLAREAGIAQAFLVIYVGNDIANGPYRPKNLSADEHGFVRYASGGRWTKARSFAVRHSMVAFYLQNAWRLLRPATAVDSQPAPVVQNHLWIYDTAAFRRDSLGEHGRVLAALRDDARLRGVPLTVVIMPERDQLYGPLSDLPNRMLSVLVAELGMPVIDLLPLMRIAAGKRPLLWNDVVEGHLSPEGNRLVSEILIQHLRRP